MKNAYLFSIHEFEVIFVSLYNNFWGIEDISFRHEQC